MTFSAILGKMAAGSTTVKPLLIGAGGFCLDISIANDGTKYTNVDIFGAWKFETTPDRWSCVTTTPRMQNLPSDSVGFIGGCQQLKVAPSNGNIAYLCYSDGHHPPVWKTIDGGSTWTRLDSFGGTGYFNSNDGTGERFNGPRMAVDPINPDVCYIGTPFNGIFFTLNGGRTWAAASGITTTTNTGNNGSGGYNMVFDKLAGATGGSTTTLYILSSDGVYKVVAATGVGTKLTGAGMPTYATSMVAGAANTIFTTDNSTGIFRGVVSGGACTWTNIYNTQTIQALAIDPSNTSRLVGLGSFSNYVETGNANGAPPTFSSAITPSQSFSGDVPWLTTTIGNTGLTTGQIQFDPNDTNKLYIACGIGVYSCTPNTTSYTINGFCRGLENLTMNRVISPPQLTNKAIVSCWDQALLKSQNQDVYPTFKGPTNSFVPAWSTDWSTDGNTLVTYCYNGPPTTDFSASSTDQGENWTTLPNHLMKFALTPSANSSGTTITFASPPPLTQDHTIDGSNGVVSVSGNTVTMQSAVSATSGVPINFYFWGRGGNISVSTANNFIICPGDRSGGPWYTLNGGSTWQACKITGTPQVGTGTSTSGSNTLTGVSFNTQTNLQVGDGIRLILNGGSYRLVTATPTTTSVTVDGAAFTVNGTEGIQGVGVSQAAYYSNQQLVCADRVNTLTHYAVWVRGHDSSFGAACYRTTDGGATWTTRSGNLSTQFSISFGNGSCECVPSNAGHILWTGNGSVGTTIFSNDGGATWTALAGVTNGGVFGFGKPKPGGSGYPTIFLSATVDAAHDANGVGGTGLWRCDNFNSATSVGTWNFISALPIGVANFFSDVDGDKNVYGRFYGTYGSAAFYGYLNSATT
jgi:hypothetical protein